MGGNITLDGIAVNNQPFNHGILLTNSSLNSGNGNVNLTGTSGLQTETNIGVWLEQSTINSEQEILVLLAIVKVVKAVISGFYSIIILACKPKQGILP